MVLDLFGELLNVSKPTTPYTGTIRDTLLRELTSVTHIRYVLSFYYLPYLNPNNVKRFRYTSI